MKRLARRTSGTISIVGFTIMLGTAGTSDFTSAPFEQILTQSIVGLIMFVAGFVLYWSLQEGW